MITCKHCESENPDHAVYCKRCGKRVDGNMPCPICGELNSDDSTYCIACGERIDGKTVCPNCGTLIEESFCTVCGTPAKRVVKKPPRSSTSANGANTAGTWRNYVNLSAGIAAMTAVLCALVFVFLIGFAPNFSGLEGVMDGLPGVSSENGSFNLWYYFGDGYREADNLFTQLPQYSATFSFSVLMPLILGTVAACLSIAGVVTFSVLAAVRFGKKVTGKSEKSYCGFAIAAVLCYFLGAHLIGSLNTVYIRLNQIVSSSEGMLKIDLKGMLAYDGATTAGTALCAVFLGCFLACKIAVRGKELIRKNTLIPLCFAVVSVAFLAALLSVLAQGAYTVKATETDTYSRETITFQTGFTTMMQILCTLNVNNNPAGEVSVIIVAQLVQFALLVILCAALLYAFKRIENDKPGAGL